MRAQPQCVWRARGGSMRFRSRFPRTEARGIGRTGGIDAFPEGEMEEGHETSEKEKPRKADLGA